MATTCGGLIKTAQFNIKRRAGGHFRASTKHHRHQLLATTRLIAIGHQRNKSNHYDNKNHENQGIALLLTVCCRPEHHDQTLLAHLYRQKSAQF